MTIRYTCPECSSVLKIKDELAGTAGKCPKCRTKFVVPAPSSDESPKADEPDTSPQPVQPLTKSEVRPPVAADTPPVIEAARPESPTNGDDGTDAKSPAAAPPDASETVGLRTSDQGTETLELPDDSSLHDGPVKPAYAAPLELALPDGDSPAPVRKSAPTAEFSKPATSFDQPLSLGDSNDDLDAMPHIDLHKKPSTASDRDIFSDDDDDSPSLMIGSLSSTTKPKSSTDSSRESEPPKVAEKKPKSSKSSAELAPFDPLKYLMDSPAQNSDTFSTGPESDADLTLDDVEESLDRQTPMPISKPKSSASMSTRATPEKVDLATAARMMKKAIKESQSEAAQQRERDAEAGFDYGLFFREFGMRGLLVLVCGFVGIMLCYFLSNYFWSSGMRLPPLGYVSGIVTLDGKPMAGAIVYIAPEDATIEGTKREKARTSMAVSDDKGRYTMLYLPERRMQGVAVGKCRVWVEHMSPMGNDVPREWMQMAMRPMLVKAGSQVEPIDMKSDPPDPRKVKK